MIFYRETEFKDTEIGRISREWDIVPLGNIIRTIKGKKSKTLLDKPGESTIISLTAEYMRFGSKPMWCYKNDPNVILVSSSDLIMIWDGSYAGGCIYRVRGCVSIDYG